MAFPLPLPPWFRKLPTGIPCESFWCLRWFLREIKVADELFWNFPWMFSTKHCFEKKTIKLIDHHSRLRDVLGQSYPIYACTRANQALFIGSRYILWQLETWQVESVEHIEQYHIKSVENSHYLKRRGRKTFVDSSFAVIIWIIE